MKDSIDDFSNGELAADLDLLGLSGFYEPGDETHRISGNGRDPHSEPINRSTRHLIGGSAISYVHKPIEPGSCLLGNRYLTRRSGMFFVAPSGQGKSTAVMQATVCWCCGRECFDIVPARPIRINLIQAEDDDADLSDMARVIDHLHFTGSELELIGKNSWIETINDQVGLDAICAIDNILDQRPCDLLILNPYTAYLGASIMDDEANSLFLRRDLQAMLNRHNCAGLGVHHTPKTNFRSRIDKWSTMDWMYSGAGASVLTNWARAILAMEPVGESGIYKFIAAKRGQRIGWEEKANYFKHDTRPGVLLWSKAEAAEIAAATGTNRHSIESETIVQAVPVLDGISMTRLRKALEEKGATQRSAKIAIDLALEDQLIHVQEIRGSGRATRIKMIHRGSDDLLNGVISP